MKQITKPSPRAKGRMTGAFYLAIFVAGAIYMVLVPSTGLLNNNDAAAIDYIVSHQPVFWAGYPFLLLAAYFNIATTMQAVMSIFLLTPLTLLGGEHYLTAFTPDQLHALAIVAMKMYHLCYIIALALFGCYDLLIGYLAFKSTFIPPIAGISLTV